MNRRFSLVLFAAAVCLLSQSKVCGQVSQYGGNQEYSLSTASGSASRQLALSTPSAASNLQMLRSDASILFSSSQFALAASAYSRLIQLGSTEASDRYWLGEALYHANDFRQAATALEQAIQTDPKYEQSYSKLAETYIALHLKEKARQVCDNGLKVVVDPYRHQQLEILLKVASFAERKPTRNRDSGLHKLPMES